MRDTVKILNIGSSKGFTINLDILENMGLKLGDLTEIEIPVRAAEITGSGSMAASFFSPHFRRSRTMNSRVCLSKDMSQWSDSYVQ